MEIIEKVYQPAQITINFEELKATLVKKLEEYKTLVVTEETLGGSKAAQKELSSMRTTIDNYRKSKKKELEAPIKSFEDQCKELIALIAEAETPLKDAINVYDDMKRDEKKKQAEEIIKEAIDVNGLYGKYADCLNVIDKYMNLTCTKKSVVEDVQARAAVLKQQQNSEEERFATIRTAIENENSRLHSKLSISDFSFIINSGADLGRVITEIKNHADRIYEAENKPKGRTKRRNQARYPGAKKGR